LTDSLADKTLNKIHYDTESFYLRRWHRSFVASSSCFVQHKLNVLRCYVSLRHPALEQSEVLTENQNFLAGILENPKVSRSTI
jgi:hypothetical protein